MKTGEKIRLLRERKGWSQEELAKAVGYVSRSSISKIESGDSDPSQKMLKRIAAALDIQASDLISDEDVQPEETKTYTPRTIQAQIVSFGMDHLPEADREIILTILQKMYQNNPDIFKRGNDDET